MTGSDERAREVDWDRIRRAVAKAAWPTAGLVDNALDEIRAALAASRPTDAGAGDISRKLLEALQVVYDRNSSVEVAHRHILALFATPKPPVDEAMRERCAVVVEEYAQSCARHADSCIGAEQHEWNRAAEELDMAATRIRNLTGDGAGA